MPVIVTVKGRSGDRLEVNGQERGALDEDGILIVVDEGDNTFSDYDGDDNLVKEITEFIIDDGERIVIDLRP